VERNLDDAGFEWERFVRSRDRWIAEGEVEICCDWQQKESCEKADEDVDQPHRYMNYRGIRGKG
jgi:hypothetical protein